MLHFIIKKLFGTNSDKKLKKYQSIVTKINELEATFSSYTKEQSQEKTKEFKERLQKGERLDALLPEAFALVRHASLSTLGQRHFDVQLLGGISLHEGQIAEMKTGEGKTLTSTLPVYLNALTGKGVHIVTVNDYLAKRDSEWMGEIYQYLGLSVGLIQHHLSDAQRREAYHCDITYGTNNEFGFDFLRDNMKFALEDYVQKSHSFAIIDEVDSILIDEARTPLIISGPSEDSTNKYEKIDQVMYALHREWRVSDNPEPMEVAKAQNISIEEVPAMIKTKEPTDVLIVGDYTLDEKSRNIQLSESGVEKMEERLVGLLKTKNLYDFENIELLHHVNQALKARYVFKRDIDYVVKDGRVIIVDEFTGRFMEGRRFSDGLHQALEAKEKVKIERENQTLASITFQNYFRKYEKLSGMTGTAETEEGEFLKIYDLGVVVIPTNKPLLRKDHPDVIYKTKKAKIRAILKLIQELQTKKQPVLVGTASIESSEELSKHLKQKKIVHSVLNAKHHEKEAEIIEKAGIPGSVTIATNMAGRGTDIKIDENVKKTGGLFILGTERHESRRIDNQLRGRSGRQGDPGASRFFMSLEDDLLRIFGGAKISNLMGKLNIDEDEAIEHVLITKAIENSQKKVEGHNFEIRKHLLEYDDVMNRQREIIYKQRKEILSDEATDLILDMSEELIQELMETYCAQKFIEDWDIKGLQQEIESTFKVKVKFPEDERLDEHTIENLLLKEIKKRYEEKKEEFGEHQKMIGRQVLLEVTDHLWKEHLLAMDHLKEGIGLRGYAQKNPLDEYKKEGFALFSELMQSINQKCVQSYFHIKMFQTPEFEKKRELSQEIQMTHGKIKEPTKPNKNAPYRKKVVIKRNDPCPCGSGKKYKNCHLKQDEEENVHLS